MAQPFIGQVIMFGGNFAPRGWAFCNGQPLPISQYDALFNLIGTTYGGDGQQTFNLPDLRGRLPFNQGTGAGLSPYVIGQTGGTESVTVTTQQLTAHNHPAMAKTGTPGGANIPSASVVLSDELQTAATASYTYTAFGSPTQSALGPLTIGLSGGSQPHENRQPVLALNYVISLFGIYPSQN